MDRGMKQNEGEMGSGESDDEFYNVKMPNTSANASSDNPSGKMKVKKVYSPSRTKVQYDYRFESSSDDESSEKGSGKRDRKDSRRGAASTESDKPRDENSYRENSNISQTTYKVVKKINEELKNMKEASLKAEKSDGSGNGASNTARAQVVPPPVVVVPPPMVVPQTAVMNVNPMFVAPGVSMASQMMGSMLRNAPGMGGLMTNPGNMMGIQGQMMGQGMGVMNPAVNLAMQGNMMRMAGGSILGVQGGNMLGMTRPGGNLMGMTRPMGTTSNMMRMAPPGNNVLAGAGGMIVSPGNVMMSNPGGVMVMNNMMGGSQASVLPAANNFRMAGLSQSNPPTRPVPPPPVLRNRPPAPGNFNWQTSLRPAGPGPKPGSPTLPTSLGVPSPSSSPVDREEVGQCDGGELSGEKEDTSSSDKSGPESREESRSSQCDVPNTFKNDGSFMEMFKRMKNEKSREGAGGERASSVPDASAPVKKPPVILSGIVGKRRGGRVLKTGLVKKVKKESDVEEEKNPKDAWSMYMAEVKKYREASCEEEGKTRPLVK